MNKPNVNAQIIRWLLLLQQFDLTIIYRLGKENVVVQFLSRLNFPTREEGMVDDHLPMNIYSPFHFSLHGFLT